MVLGRDLHGHEDRNTARPLTKMLHQQQGCLLDPSTLPLASLDHDGHGVEVLLLGPGDDLDIVLVHDGPHVGAVCVRGSLENMIKIYLKTVIILPPENLA